MPTPEPDILGAFYQSLGYGVEVCGGVIWRDAGRLALAAEPSGAIPTASIAEIQAMLQRRHRLAAIFCTEAPSGKTVSVFVADGGSGDSALQRQFRQQVRHARQTCTVRRIGWDEWRDLGLACDRSSLLQHGKAGAPVLHANGRQALTQSAAASDLEIYGCFAGESLAAYFVCRVADGVCQGIAMHWDEAFVSHHPTHLLYADATRTLLSRDDIREVRIGRQVVPPNPGLDRFKRHAGYRTRPCHVAVVIHPIAAPLLAARTTSRLIASARTMLAPLWPGAAALEVLELAAPSHVALKAKAPAPL